MKTIEEVVAERLYTKAEYAKKIRKSQAWVHKLIQQNKLQVLKINGGTVIVAPLEN